MNNRTGFCEWLMQETSKGFTLLKGCCTVCALLRGTLLYKYP